MLIEFNCTYISDKLSEKLACIATHPVTTIVAPVGYGKTKAIGWWLENYQKQRKDVLFLRQTIVSDSLTDFWQGFCRNCKPIPELKEEMELLGLPLETRALVIMLELLEDALLHSDKEIYYIVEDLHFITDARLQIFLQFICHQLPHNVHLILISRNRIFDRATRLKLGARLWELHKEDLRLGRNDFGKYAGCCGIELTKTQTDELWHSTEGWFSMAYLNLQSYVQKGVWLSGSEDIHRIIEEVLFQPLSERQREFLVVMGIPQEFTAAQAHFLWKDEDASELLEALTEQNAFISKESNGMYRYHNMLQECAVVRFADLEEADRYLYLKRLGQWYENTHAYYQAALYYEECGTWNQLLRMILMDQAASINGENKVKLLSWCQNCPEDIMEQNPDTLLVLIRKLFSFGYITEMIRLKDLLLKALNEDTTLTTQEKNNYLGECELEMSYLGYNDIAKMSEFHRRACALMNRQAVSVDHRGNWTFGSPSVLMMFHRIASDLDRENEYMRECMPYYYQITDSHGNGVEHVMQGETDFLRGHVEDADLEYGFAVVAAEKKEQYSVLLAAAFLKLQINLFKGDLKSSISLLEKLNEQLRKEQRYILLYTLDLCEAWMYSLLGQKKDFPLWLTDKNQPSPMLRPASPMLEIIRNQVYLVEKQWVTVAAREEQVSSCCKEYNSLLCTIYLEIQLSIAYHGLNKQKKSIEHLTNALEMAMPDSILMPFVFSYDDLCDQLQKITRWQEKVQSIKDLVEQYRKAKATILRDCGYISSTYQLTERELVIARLAVQRKTNKEIAETLCLAEGTVRNQLSQIFSKLGIEGNTKNKRMILEKYCDL